MNRDKRNVVRFVGKNFLISLRTANLYLSLNNVREITGNFKRNFDIKGFIVNSEINGLILTENDQICYSNLCVFKIVGRKNSKLPLVWYSLMYVGQ